MSQLQTFYLNVEYLCGSECINISNYCNSYVFFLYLCVVGGLQFVSPYNDKKVSGVLGSSINFTWAFSGGNVDQVQWGTKRDGALNFQQLLVTVRKDTTSTVITNSPYSGRVSGVWDGSSPGQVTFTLNSIQKADERAYICRLGPESLIEVPVYDSVQLLALGK